MQRPRRRQFSVFIYHTGYIIESQCCSWVIVADYRKNSDVLGTNVGLPVPCSAFDPELILFLQWKQGVPVEVAPFAYRKVLNDLKAMGSTNATLRMAKAKAGPVVSDNGMFVIDAPFPEAQMKDPVKVRGSCIRVQRRRRD